MTASSQTVSPSSFSWESFALTDSRWLIHAMAWSLGLLLTLLLFPWLVSGPSTILGIAGLAAVTTAYTDRREPLTLSPSTIVRYMLVDGIFVSCALLPVFLLVQLALAAGGLSPRIWSMGYGLVLIFAFVCAFYLCLAVVNRMRSGQVSLRVIPSGRSHGDFVRSPPILFHCRPDHDRSHRTNCFAGFYVASYSSHSSLVDPWHSFYQIPLSRSLSPLSI